MVNPGSTFSIHEPAEGSIEAPLTVLSELPQKGLVRHIGLSNAARADRRSPTDRSDRLRAEPLPLAHRTDDALIADLARDGIAYVPFFPLGGFTPLQSTTFSDVAARLGATPMQVALAWLLQRPTNSMLIPGTSSIEHLRENLRSSMLQIPPEVIADLGAIGGSTKSEAHSGRASSARSPETACRLVGQGRSFQES